MSHSRSQTRLLTLFQDNKLDVPHQTSFPLDTLLMHIYPRIRLERLDLRGTYPGVSTPWKNTTPFVLKKRKNPFSTRESSVPPLSLSLSHYYPIYTTSLLKHPVPSSILYTMTSLVAMRPWHICGLQKNDAIIARQPVYINPQK